MRQNSLYQRKIAYIIPKWLIKTKMANIGAKWLKLNENGFCKQEWRI